MWFWFLSDHFHTAIIRSPMPSQSHMLSLYLVSMRNPTAALALSISPTPEFSIVCSSISISSTPLSTFSNFNAFQMSQFTFAFSLVLPNFTGHVFCPILTALVTLTSTSNCSFSRNRFFQSALRPSHPFPAMWLLYRLSFPPFPFVLLNLSSRFWSARLCVFNF